MIRVPRSAFSQKRTFHKVYSAVVRVASSAATPYSIGLGFGKFGPRRRAVMTAHKTREMLVTGT